MLFIAYCVMLSLCCLFSTAASELKHKVADDLKKLKNKEEKKNTVKKLEKDMKKMQKKKKNKKEMKDKQEKIREHDKKSKKAKNTKKTIHEAESKPTKVSSKPISKKSRKVDKIEELANNLVQYAMFKSQSQALSKDELLVDDHFGMLSDALIDEAIEQLESVDADDDELQDQIIRHTTKIINSIPILNMSDDKEVKKIKNDIQKIIQMYIVQGKDKQERASPLHQTKLQNTEGCEVSGAYKDCSVSEGDYGITALLPDSLDKDIFLSNLWKILIILLLLIMIIVYMCIGSKKKHDHNNTAKSKSTKERIRKHQEFSNIQENSNNSTPKKEEVKQDTNPLGATVNSIHVDSNESKSPHIDRPSAHKLQSENGDKIARLPDAKSTVINDSSVHASSKSNPELHCHNEEDKDCLTSSLTFDDIKEGNDCAYNIVKSATGITLTVSYDGEQCDKELIHELEDELNNIK